MSPEQEDSGPKLRFVVSSFIFSFVHGEPRVALFRRSDQVRTYPHRLGAISGTVRGGKGAVKAAWREFEEETTLTRQDLDLWRAGMPHVYLDESINRKWNILPFLFRLKTPEEGGRGEGGIKINWEHTEWQWYDPKSIRDDENFGGVPRLAESLNRVWFEAIMNEEASRVLQSGLEQLRSDHTSGSHELTSIALNKFRDVLSSLRKDENWWYIARITAWHLWKNGRPSMGTATMSALLDLLVGLEGLHIKKIDTKSKRDQVLWIVDHHLQLRLSMPLRIKRSFAEYLRSEFLSDHEDGSQFTLSILTLSASSTIRDSIIDAFVSLPISTLDLRVLESRPLFEGAKMAFSIASEFQAKYSSSTKKDLQVKVYTDASAALASRNLDIVLLGADHISVTGKVINKTGSVPAILSAKRNNYEVKVLVMSELEKVAEPGTESNYELEQDDPAEVMKCWPDASVTGSKYFEGATSTRGEISNCNVTVENDYFEWIGEDLIDGFVCEEGFLDPKKLFYQSVQVGEKKERYFGHGWPKPNLEILAQYVLGGIIVD